MLVSVSQETALKKPCNEASKARQLKGFFCEMISDELSLKTSRRCTRYLCGQAQQKELPRAAMRLPRISSSAPTTALREGALQARCDLNCGLQLQTFAMQDDNK